MTHQSSSRQTTGILLMTCAMLFIPIVDGLAKYLSSSYSPLFLGWARYAMAALIVLLGVYPKLMTDMIEPAVDSIVVRVES